MIEHYSYALHEQIGKGFSSKVFLGKNEKTGEVVAVKVIYVR
jgi:serine/threonine protein kinase